MKRISAPGAPCIDCLQVLIQSCSITASTFEQSWPPSTSLNSLDRGIQPYHQTCSIKASKLARSWPPSAYLQTRSIMAIKCVSKPARLWPSNSLNRGLQVHISKFARSRPPKCLSNLARLQPPIASTNSLDHNLGVYLYVHSIMASKCISKYPRLPPPSAAPNSLAHGLGVHLWVYSMVIFRCTSNFSQALPAATVRIYGV